MTAYRPHRFPDSARDVDWLLAWTCAACGTAVSEYGPQLDDCTVEWRPEHKERTNG